jgi:hypothetical protein
MIADSPHSSPLRRVRRGGEDIQATAPRRRRGATRLTLRLTDWRARVKAQAARTHQPPRSTLSRPETTLPAGLDSTPACRQRGLRRLRGGDGYDEFGADGDGDASTAGIVWTAPPASSRDRAAWVMSARVATSVLDHSVQGGVRGPPSPHDRPPTWCSITPGSTQTAQHRLHSRRVGRCAALAVR